MLTNGRRKSSRGRRLTAASSSNLTTNWQPSFLWAFVAESPTHIRVIMPRPINMQTFSTDALHWAITINGDAVGTDTAASQPADGIFHVRSLTEFVAGDRIDLEYLGGSTIQSLTSPTANLQPFKLRAIVGG